MKDKIKNILVIAIIIAVIAATIIALLLILEIGDNQELTQSLFKILKVLGVLVLASILILGVLRFSNRQVK